MLNEMKSAFGGNIKKILASSAVSALMLGATIIPAFGAGPSTCATIKDGTITDSTGNPVALGYDQWGYNYQAHMFNGYAGNFSRPTVPVTSGDKLNMKWSDAWLANVDCMVTESWIED